MIPTADSILGLAQNILQTRYPGADFAFACGSLIRGEGTMGSDLDLVVVFPSLPRGFRESFIHEGLPVEVFAHDQGTLQFYVDEAIKSGSATMAHMVATGAPLPAGHPVARRVQGHIRDWLAAGPTQQTDEARDSRLYTLTDMIDDLHDERPLAEARALLIRLHPMLSEQVLLAAGHYAGYGKHLARALARHRPDVAAALDAALTAAMVATATVWRLPSDLRAPLEKILAELGGPLFDGFHSQAPIESRAVARWQNQNQD